MENWWSDVRENFSPVAGLLTQGMFEAQRCEVVTHGETLEMYLPLIILLPRVLLNLHHVTITGITSGPDTIDRYRHR